MSEMSDKGRYQIVACPVGTGMFVVLVDSTNGRSWKLSFEANNVSGWRPMKFLDLNAPAAPPAP